MPKEPDPVDLLLSGLGDSGAENWSRSPRGSETSEAAGPFNFLPTAYKYLGLRWKELVRRGLREQKR